MMQGVREREIRYGTESLTNAELLALFLYQSQHDRAIEIVKNMGSLSHLLTMGMTGLIESGFSVREASMILAIPELLKRIKAQGGARLTSPSAAGKYLLEKYHGQSEEVFGMIALSAKGSVLADRIISKGTTTGTLVSPREVFKEAMKFGASSVLVWHNHPSGDPTPSREDINLTKRIRGAGEMLGIVLADHIIVGNDSWHSFRAAEGWDSL